MGSKRLFIRVVNVGSVRKRAIVRISSKTRLGKRGHNLVPRSKPKTISLSRKSTSELVRAVCALLESQEFFEGDIKLSEDASALFEVKSSSYGEGVVITPRTESDADTAGKSRKSSWSSTIRLEETMCRYRVDERLYKKLVLIQHENRINGGSWYLKFLAKEDRGKRASSASIVKMRDVVCILKNFYFLRLKGMNSHKAAEAAGSIGGTAATGTVLRWKKLFESRGGALWIPKSGMYDRRCLLTEEDVQLSLLDFLIENADKRGCPNLTASSFQQYVNFKILPELRETECGQILLKRCNIGEAVSLTTTYKWLKKLWFEWTSVLRTGYCDGRNREDVQKYKMRYCETMKMLQIHMPLWTHLSISAFRVRFPNSQPEHWYVDSDAVEFSCDALSDDELFALNYRFVGDWSRRAMPPIPSLGVKEGDKILLFSQDKCVFKSNDGANRAWRKHGVNNHQRKKSEGRGVMVSGFISESDGFLRFNEEEMQELEDIYAEPFTLTRSLAKLLRKTEFAGCSVTSHLYGKNYDGYWDNEKIMKHTREFLRCADYRYRRNGVKILILFDWSSGHSAMADDALVAGKMGWNYGGRQPIMHATVVLDHYPKANNPALRNLGAVQSMVFEAGQKPFYKLSSAEDFTGVAKGLKQVLWERGLLTKDMTMMGKRDKNGVQRKDTCGVETMAAQIDFQWEACALSQLVVSTGHVCLFTPKFHPELNFIERAWGRAKWFLRLFCHYSLPSLREKIGRALGLQKLKEDERNSHRRLEEREFLLDALLVRKYARKSRDYINIYTTFDIKQANRDHMKKVKFHRASPKREFHGEL